MSVSYWNDKSSLKPNKEYDVVVIGGGIAGLSTAYWLQKEDPDLKIALLEKYQIGSGATGRNAGFITCGSVEHFNRLVNTHGEEEALAIWRFSEKNLSLLQEHVFNQDQQTKTDFAQSGSFSLASSKEEFVELKKSADLMERMNINVEILDEDAIVKRLVAKNFIGGIKYKDDASVNPIQLLHSLRQLFATKVDIFENCEVYRVENLADSKLVMSNQFQFKSSIVVYATNGYSPLLHDFFTSKVFPTRGQILTTEAVEPFMEGPCYANFVLDYFRQLPSGELIIGGFRQLQKDVELGYSDETSPLIQNALEQFIIDHLPLLKGKKITHRWSGIMGFSVDGQPMIGSLPDDQQSFFTIGFTAHGLGLAFHSSKCLVDLIFGREIPKFITAKRFN